MRNLQERIRNKLNDFRAIDRLVNSFDFEYIYISLPENERDILMTLLITGQKEAVIDFITTREERVIDEMSIRKLREIAGRMSIEYYTRLSRAELIATIIRTRLNERLAG